MDPRMESELSRVSYDMVDPEEIILKLKEILAYLQKRKQEEKL
jgi:hypothetical protein